MINLLEKTNVDERYLTFTDTVKIIGSGTNNRIPHFARDGKIQSYRVPLSRRLGARESEVLDFIQVKAAGNE
jgi:rRNA maturation protein Nop10